MSPVWQIWLVFSRTVDSAVPLLPSSEGLWVIYIQRIASAGELRKDSVGLGCLLAQGQTFFMMVQTPSFRGGEEAALAIPNSK